MIMKNNSPLNKLFSIVFILSFCGIIFVSCKKNDLDLEDPTVYQWEVTETWSSFMPNNDQGDITVNLGDHKLVAKVEIRWLTNAEVHELKQKDKRNKDVELKFKKLAN